ncbi:hypothetical protein HXX76_003133 [Chlamydomonas incerta]|uniref:Uncharacterized protein n=1 Tax=Chlamydomonas incerta TaxID=51695 RepID=A0A835TCF4_CHLIN|nr:hypothetical protein HXX76_003133 [Chlamydomonas incerta]|eukprot:KAG2441511.1 hypothetical protein HXX76_003133 [Chlamydomonas incerta]
MAESRADCGLTRLTPGLIQRIASFLHPNEVASSFKLVSKEIADILRAEFQTFTLCRRPAQPSRLLPCWPALNLRPIAPPPLAELPWPGADFVAHWGRLEPWRVLNRQQRHLLLCLAASSHHPPSLDAALAHCGVMIGAEALAAAVAVGDLDVCERLLNEEGCEWDASYVWSAAVVMGGGSAGDVLRWLQANTAAALQQQQQQQQQQGLLHWDSEVEAAAVQVEAAACFCGAREVLGAVAEWAGRQPAGGRRRAPHVPLAAAAAAGGQVELLQLLQLMGELVEKPEGEEEEDDEDEEHQASVLSGVAYGCELEVLQWQYERWRGEAAGSAGGEAAGAGAEGSRAAARARRRSRQQQAQQAQLLLRAVTSPTADWAAKAEWLLGRWGGPQPGGWPPVAGSVADAEEPRSLWRVAALQPSGGGYSRRLQWLATRGLAVPCEAVEAAGWVGDLGAVELCLGLPSHVPAAGGPYAAPGEEQQQAPQQALAFAAVAAGQVAVLRLLAARGVPVRYDGPLVREAVGQCAAEGAASRSAFAFGCLPALRYLAAEGGLAAAAAGGLEAATGGGLAAAAAGGLQGTAAVAEAGVDWSQVFITAAAHGADLALLRCLHEQHGAAVDLVAIAAGGSEEQLEWAAAQEQQQQQLAQQQQAAADAVEPFQVALTAGNWAAADWLLRHRGLLGAAGTPPPPPQQQQLPQQQELQPFQQRQEQLQHQLQLQRVFCALAGLDAGGGGGGAPRHVPALWHLYRWCDLQWSRRCARALRRCAARAGHTGRLRVVSGQARQSREMLRDADAALADGRCGGGARRESVVREEGSGEEEEEEGSGTEEDGEEEDGEGSGEEGV